MRNLKKILALVLALVMSLSLVTIANAADFTDSDDISYEEAADVMSTIGVIEGFENGSFDPDGTLTREQAAKLVTYMLLGTNADRLGVEGSTFKDVAATRWSASAIEYCASLGLIDGAGDGNFYPAGQLTANAFAKILLTALGYSSEKEGMTGTSWSVNVAALAIEVGLDNGIEDLSWTDVLSREEAAQMALNAIQAPLVAYENDVTIVVGDTPVSFGSGDAYYVTTTLAREQRISTQRLSNTNDYTVEFGERYFPNLRLVSESDEFERPSHTWVYENEEIGTYVDYNLLQETYTEGVTGETLYNLLGRTAIADYELEVYVDGVDKLDETGGISKADLRRNNDDDLAPTGNGVLTQVFMDHDNEVITITCINTYLAQANGDYNERNETVSLTIYESNATGTTQRVEYIDVPEIEDLTEGQYVLVNMSGKDRSGNKLEVVKVEDVEILTDATVTRFSQSGGEFKSLTADGEAYNASEKSFYDIDNVLNDYNSDYLTDMTYNVYLDQYGYAIGVDLYEGTLNYVFITGYDRGQSYISVKTAQAAGIFLDGSMEEITVNVTATNKNIKNTLADGYKGGYFAEWNNDGASALNRWYTYTERDGVYTLKPATQSFSSKYTADATINCSNVRVEDGVNSGIRAYGNDDSVFITVDQGVVDHDPSGQAITEVTGLYTGVQNVDIEIDKSEVVTDWAVHTVYDKDNYIIASIVVGEAQGSIANYAYILDTDADVEWIDNDGTYYWEFDAVVDGEVVTLTVRSKYEDVFSDLQAAAAAGKVVELRYDGEYVTSVKDDLKAYVNTDLNGSTDGFDYYNISMNGKTYPDHVLTLRGRTMYVTETWSDYGLTFTSDAKAVVRQDEDEKTNVITEYGSVSEAIAALADADPDTTELEYDGQITAVLNSQGVAEWIVFDSSTKLETGSGAGTSTGSQKVTGIRVNSTKDQVILDLAGNGEKGDEYTFALYQLRDNGYVLVDELTATIQGTLNLAWTSVKDIVASGETYQAVYGNYRVTFTA